MILFIIGLLSGIISGMGIGGGTVLIPGLILFSDVSQHQAQGINLVVFIPIAIAALTMHYRNKSLYIKMAIPIILSGLVGAYIGSILALSIPSEMMRKIFGVFLCIMGLYEMFGKVQKINKTKP